VNGRWSLRFALTCGALASAAACGGGHDDAAGLARASSTARQSAIVAPKASPSARSTTSKGLPTTSPPVAPCDESVGANPTGTAGAIQIGPLTFSELKKAAARTSLAASGGGTYTFKTFLIVAARAKVSTITVHSLDGALAALDYTNDAREKVGTGQSLAPRFRTVVVQGCPDGLAGYPGGVIVSRPTCLAVEVFSGGHKQQQVVAIGRSRCPG